MNIDTTLAISGAISLFVISAAGSVLGTSVAASAAIGSWKKCFTHNKPAPFTLLTFVGMPLTNSLYGMVLMFSIIPKALTQSMIPGAGYAMLAMCIFVGLIIAFAAWMQTRAAACACDAQGETGQGFGNYIAAIGIIEGVTIFIFVFTLVVIGNFFAPASAAEPPAPVLEASAEAA